MDKNSADSSGLPNTSKKESQQVTFMKAAGIATEFGFIIALPLLLFIYLGKWLDNRYHAVFFVYIGIVLALSLTTFWLYRKINALLKDLKQP